MTPLQRSSIAIARRDRRAAARPTGSAYGLRPILAQLAQTIAIVSAIALVGLASYHWHSRDAVPQCLATSYDDCE